MLEHADEAEVVIPAGPFVMGRAPEDIFARPAEQPARIVTLSAFAIDVHPVSNRRFREFVELGGYDEPTLWSRAGWRWRHAQRITGPRSLELEGFDADEQPACGLSWYEAQAFCAFLGRRLPTSAEWERAARGLDARAFPWGEALPRRDLCNFAGQVGRTTPLGGYPAGVSPSGCHDMAGNVNNWVADVEHAGFGAWCLREGKLQDPFLARGLAERLGLDAERRSDRGGGFLTAFSQFEVLGTTLPLGWPAGSREMWHGLRTARALAGPRTAH